MSAAAPSDKDRTGNLGRIFVADVAFGSKVISSATEKFVAIDGVTLELADPVTVCTANGSIAAVKKFTVAFPADRADPQTLKIKDVVVAHTTEAKANIDIAEPAKVLTFEFGTPLPIARQDSSVLSCVKKVVLSFPDSGGMIAETILADPTPALLRYWREFPDKLTPPVIPDPPVGWIGKDPREAVPPVIPDPVIGWIGKK